MHKESWNGSKDLSGKFRISMFCGKKQLRLVWALSFVTFHMQKKATEHWWKGTNQK